MKRKKSKLILSAILCAAIMCSCSNSEDALPSLDNLSEGVVSANTEDEVSTETNVISSVESAAVESETKTESDSDGIADDEMMADIEEQIKILEEYYESDVKKITEIMTYPVESIGNAKIYDLDCNGNCTMIVHFRVSLGGWPGSVDMAYTVDENGQVYEETFNLDTSGGMAQSSKIILTYINNGRFYIFAEDSTTQSSEELYFSRGEKELNMMSYWQDGLYFVNSYAVTSSSYDKVHNFLAIAMKEPVPTRMDGETEIYLPDYSNISDEKILTEAQLIAPEKMSVEKLDDKIRFSWENSRDDIFFNIYKIKNDEYIKIGETTDNFYEIDSKETGEYCMTVSAIDPAIRESDYSEVVVIENAKDYTTYSAMDFIGENIGKMYEFAGEQFKPDFMKPNVFEIANDKIPYQFMSEYRVAEDFGGNFVGYDCEVSGVKAYKNAQITDTIVFDDNIHESIQKEFNVTTCSIKPVFEYMGFMFDNKVEVYYIIDGGMQIILVCEVEPETEIVYEESDFEEDIAAGYDKGMEEYLRKINERYLINKINVEDAGEFIDGEVHNCIIKTYDSTNYMGPY